MEKHWTERMFIESAPFFRADLEGRVERAREQVAALVTVFKELSVPQGGLVLDLACGIGRHSVVLAEEGYRVVGVDFSPTYIERAGELAKERGVSGGCDLRVGDMRRIGEVIGDLSGKLDAVISMYTSMGYYDEETDRDVLSQLHGLSAEGCVLVIDGAPRDRMLRNWRAQYVNQLREDLVLIQESRFDLETSRIENVWKYYTPEGSDLKHYKTVETSHRVYSLHELKAIVEGAGWKYHTCYGSFDLEPFTLDSRRIVLVAQKS
jgi:SAM-dependent methyltransferase